MPRIRTDTFADTQPCDDEHGSEEACAVDARHLALAIAWSRDEPERVGEVALFAESTGLVLGRGESGPQPRARFVRQRPSGNEARAALDSPTISREQLRVAPHRGALRLENVGRAALVVGRRRVSQCTLRVGDLACLGGQLLLLCVERPLALPTGPRGPAFDFGRPDGTGFLGESPVAWQLREQVAFAAAATGHVLVLGPSGAGKELVARAVHTLSSRRSGPFVARNAATLPVGIVDAELFGTARNYPNPGTPERPGLVGSAEGGTLLLDEIAELPPTAHANLLRVLDPGGQYHRLGEARPRRADVRFVGATNRDPESLREDLLARFVLRVAVPGLDARREDVPLLIRELLDRAQRAAPELVERFVDETGHVRVSPDLVEMLVRHAYTTHVRELERLLWAAMASSPRGVVEAPPVTRRADDKPALPERVARRDLVPDEIRGAVQTHGGNMVRAAASLGLPSRYTLYRLLRQHNIRLDDLRKGD